MRATSSYLPRALTKTHPTHSAPDGPIRGRALLIATFGILCVTALLGQAVARLTPLALEPWEEGMAGWQIALYLGWVVLNAYTEGYRAFQLRFSPRVVSRALHLGRNPRALWVVLALPFCMSLFHSTKRQKIVSWSFIVIIVALVIAVRQLPQPWRGIIDGGVVVGLAWGLAALWFFFGRAVWSGLEPATIDLPSDQVQNGQKTEDEERHGRQPEQEVRSA